MASLNDVKKMIIQEFNSRTNDYRGKINFQTDNEDILDGIARTYIYYDSNFPQPINASEITGADRIPRMLNKPMPKTMAELYLDRLLLNLLEIGKTTDAKGLVADSGIFFDRDSMDRQLPKWKGDVYFGKKVDLLKGNEEVIKKNLNDKVIIHELSHMSAIPVVNSGAGFYGGTTVKNKQTYASRFEEICAEATALNVTGQKIPSHISIKSDNVKVSIGGYNPESSNYAISSFIELAPFAFGKNELEMGRMLNPVGYMEELNSKYSAFAREGGTFAGRVQEDLKAIVENKEYARLPKLQSDFMKIGMRRISDVKYLNSCDEIQFKRDVGCMLRLKPLLYKRFVDNNLQQTENIVEYDRAMEGIKKAFDLMKTQRNMFQKYNSFEEFTAEGEKTIEYGQRKALGIQSVPIQNHPQSNINVDNKQSMQNATTVNFTSNYSGSAKPPESINPTVVTVTPATTSNSYTYKQVDVKKEHIGEISKAQHKENVKYQFVCETINNLFGNESTGLCAIKPKDAQNIKIIESAKRVWQAMAYDNGMRIINSNGKEISVRDMLRKYYQEESGFNQDSIPNKILSNPTVPDEIKSLFEDLYISKGLHGMAEIIENDATLAMGRNPDDVISEAIHSYVDYEPKQWLTLHEYDEQCKMGDIQYDTAKYLQQNYNFFGGYNDSTSEQRESAKGLQENLLKWLSQSLDIAKSRSENYLDSGHSIN